MEVQGKIKRISDTQTLGSGGFRKREVIVTTEEQYPQHLAIEFVQDKTELLNNFREGQTVRVSINLRGREWVSPQGETKYFNSIQGWRIDAVDALSSQTGSPVPPAAAFQPLEEMNDEEQDDLPF